MEGLGLLFKVRKHLVWSGRVSAFFGKKKYFFCKKKKEEEDFQVLINELQHMLRQPGYCGRVWKYIYLNCNVLLDILSF